MGSLDRAALFDDRLLAGLALCQAYSALVDDWARGLYTDSAAPESGVALVAVGGYGRAELSPQSDIDLLLLHDAKIDVALFAERLWYPIWDEGLKLGHAVRTPKEALALAADDLDTATSYLSLRVLAGDVALGNDVATRAEALWRKRSKRWLGELSRRVRDRHESAGEVAFLLEPDIKDGRGGLRDVHSIHYAEAAQRVMLEGDDHALAAAYEILLGVRVELHRRTKRPGDRLLLQEQDGIAEDLGYASADDLMQAVAHAARTIAWTCDEVWFRVESSLKGPASIRLRRDKAVADGVVLREGLIHLDADVDPANDPLATLRVALAAAQNDAPIERASLDRLAARTPSPFPWSAPARDLFAALLLVGRPTVRVIETLDQRGIWTRLLPEWQPVRCKPQRNAYHTFTVDRHLCEASANSAELVDQVERRDLLVVGTLLHDIGKGYPGDHVEVGIDVVTRIGERMGYPPDDVAVLCDMVRHHLLLPDIATRRDLDDEATIRFVADAAGSLSTLHLLGALTEADSLATGPAAWNSWKASLVAVLMQRTGRLLSGGTPDEFSADSFPNASLRDRLERRELVVEGSDDRLVVIAPDRPRTFSRIAGVLSLHGLAVLGASAYSDEHGWLVDEFRVESSFGPAIPWAKVIADLEPALAGRLALSARLVERARTYARVGPQPPRAAPFVHVDNDLSPRATVVEVHASDGVAVLYRIATAIAELELDIASAKVQTMGATVVDAFYVRDRDGCKIIDRDRLSELERAILHALEDGLP